MPTSPPVHSSRSKGSRIGLGPVLALALLQLSVTVGIARGQVPGAGRAPAASAAPVAASTPLDDRDPFAHFDLPDEWEARFWADPGVKSLLAIDSRALADLVPVQAGVRHCRCPGCDAVEADDPLAWSVLKPTILTCRHCGLTVPNDQIPARNEKKVPEETIEVLPRVLHRYPYHVVEPEKQRLPDERLYLSAKRDYEAREFLAKAALYAAVRSREREADPDAPTLARVAAVILLRFAQVYPAYATHYDQPGEPKFFQPANLPPPYRRGYRTGKWDWTANLDVPMNLVIAYALIRGSPALVEAGRVLGDPNPSRTIERDLFRASAEFVRLQPEEFGEMSLHAYRGLLAVGRLLGDDTLVHEARARLDAFAERGFYHDGCWRQGDANAHRRVVGLIDGWIGRLSAGPADLRGIAATATGRRDPVRRADEVPMLALARGASAAMLADPGTPEVLQASWPSRIAESVPRHPALLGGAGLARLAVGKADAALDIELRGLDGHGGPHFQRQAIRLAVNGRPVLGDLDEQAPTVGGWDRATASHNTVVVDGLNQRESPTRAQTPADGGRFLFFAADPDFQVAVLDDPHAYPRSTERYRQTLIVGATGRARYGVSVFEVRGGLQHDQVFHAAPGSTARWRMSAPMAPGPATLLPPSIRFFPDARTADGRWFVQAYGEFRSLSEARLSKPTMASLNGPDGLGIRLHVLSDTPMTAYTASSPDPSVGTDTDIDAGTGPGQGAGRAGLILRRRSEDGATLTTTFVNVFEPIATGAPPLLRVGRAHASPGTVIVYLETAQGSEHLVINLEPGTVREVKLPDGRALRTDGVAVRVTPHDLTLAGGSFAESGGGRARQEPASGRVVAAHRDVSSAGPGYFLTDAAVPDPDALVGRTLLIRHGDGTVRGWTLTRVENTPDGDAARLHVHEEPGFLIEPESGHARYYQFPRNTAPGPHAFHVPRLTRAATTASPPRSTVPRAAEMPDPRTR